MYMVEVEELRPIIMSIECLSAVIPYIDSPAFVASGFNLAVCNRCLSAVCHINSRYSDMHTIPYLLDTWVGR